MKNLILFSCILGLGTMVSCDKDETMDSQPSTVSGAAVKGYVGAAKVDVYEYQSSGDRGTKIATTQTDTKGNYQFSVDYRGPVEIVVSEGSYKDEASGVSVSLQSRELRSVAVLKGGSQSAAVSALTTIAAEYADVNATANVEASITDANTKVAQAFGLAGLDISGEIPADLTFASTGLTKAQVQYGAVQAGLSQVVMENSLTADQLLALLDDIAKDLSDDAMDGKAGSAALQTSLNLTPAEAMAGLNIAIKNFMNSDMNASGYSATSVDISVPAPRTSR